MKRLLLVLMFANLGVAWGQDAADCSTLYDHGDHRITLCSVTVNGVTTYSEHVLTDSSASIADISHDTYSRMMTSDIADLEAHTAQIKAIQEQAEKDEAARESRHAADAASQRLQTKKTCKSAGYVWKYGTCLSKDVK